MIFYDTETCGFHGMCVLIQYAEDDGPVNLHSVWTEQVIDTLKLIEWLMGYELCGFNLAFDHFHLCKLHTIFSLLPPHAYPEELIDLVAKLEPKGRDGQCIKPKAACDVMLHARKGPYQSTMDRRDIKIRKIPNRIADDVRDILEKTVKLDDIYFARRKDKYASRWQIFDSKEEDFSDIVLKFKASSALKNLVVHALKIPPEQVLRYGDVEVEKRFRPIEIGYAPFALALSTSEIGWRAKIKKGSGWQRGYAWPGVIRRHISHWTSNKLAREYATDDVIYTRDIWKHLGSPPAGDDDSELACMVGAVRWRGFKIDTEEVKKLKVEAVKTSNSAPKSPNAVKTYLLEVMDEIEGLAIEESTKRVLLEEVAMWEDDDGVKHRAAKRAQEVLDARMAKWEADLYTKLLTAGRFHAAASVIGALSGRMSGRGGDLNPQGIKRTKYIRRCFPLAGNNMVLCGGDFDAFEVVLAIAYYGDEKLAEAVKSGKKVHALFGTHVYPTMSYEEVLADKEKYTRSKSGVFALIYFGNAFTLKTRLGVPLEIAEKAYQAFIKQYPGIGEGRKKIIDMFQSMKQLGGIGTRVEWHDPKESIESMFGFSRFFTLENQIGKILFTLARKPPKEWKKYKEKVVRRDREQTISGAVQSALYAAAFALQASNTRAAGNHVIQSSGAQITKKVQRSIWDIQPCGVGPWLVQPLNIHDEIMCPTDPMKTKTVKKRVDETVKGFRERVPLLKMEWNTGLKSWADK